MKNIFKGFKDKLNDDINTLTETEDSACEESSQAHCDRGGHRRTRPPNERSSHTDPLPRSTKRHGVREKRHNSYGNGEGQSRGQEQNLSDISRNSRHNSLLDEPPKVRWRIGPFAILSPKPSPRSSNKRGRRYSRSENRDPRNHKKEKSSCGSKERSNSHHCEEETSDQGEGRHPQRRMSKGKGKRKEKGEEPIEEVLDILEEDSTVYREAGSAKLRSLIRGVPTSLRKAQAQSDDTNSCKKVADKVKSPARNVRSNETVERHKAEEETKRRKEVDVAEANVKRENERKEAAEAGEKRRVDEARRKREADSGKPSARKLTFPLPKALPRAQLNTANLAVAHNPGVYPTLEGSEAHPGIGDMARTYVQGMVTKAQKEANDRLRRQKNTEEQEKKEEERKQLEVLQRGTLALNEGAGIGDMGRTYVQGMVTKEQKEYNDRLRRAHEREEQKKKEDDRLGREALQTQAANFGAGIGDMERTYVQAMVPRQVKDAVDRQRQEQLRQQQRRR